MSRPKMTDEQKAAAKAEREAQKAAQAVEPAPTVEPDSMPTLAGYIAQHERDGIVLVRVTYPGAEPHVFSGKYSGIVVADGPLSCTYADGSTS